MAESGTESLLMNDGITTTVVLNPFVAFFMVKKQVTLTKVMIVT